MSPAFEFLFRQYSGYATLDIVLELIGVLLWTTQRLVCQKKYRIWVYPTGMISTAIFVYLLLKWALLGDMIINAYFFVL